MQTIGCIIAHSIKFICFVSTYSTPFRDLELRNKWELAIFGKTNVQCFRLCHFHFNEEDFVETNKGIVLKKGAVPIPPVPETENEENIDKG